MSTTYCHYYVKGYLIPANAGVIKGKKRGCKHSIDISVKFCPECGKPVFIEYEEDLMMILQERLEERLDYGTSSIRIFGNEKDHTIIGIRVKNNNEIISKEDFTFFEYPEVKNEDIEELDNFIKENNVPISGELKTFVIEYIG